MEIVRLPCANTRVALRAPCGDEDLLLLEAGPPSLRVALQLLERVLEPLNGVPIDCAALPITDVDALLLSLRRALVGDLVRADTTCTAPTCRARVDLSFSIQDYVEHHAGEAGPELVPAGERGWYRLEAAGIELRAPCAGDQLAIESEPDPERVLLERCVRPLERAVLARAEVEAALERLAPSLCGELQAPCPECGATVTVEFDPLQYVLRELRDRAGWLYEDVAWIAQHYHWSEAEILALPAARRARYAELAAEHARQRRSV